jgi:hypothetical protein
MFRLTGMKYKIIFPIEPENDKLPWQRNIRQLAPQNFNEIMSKHVALDNVDFCLVGCFAFTPRETESALTLIYDL